MGILILSTKPGSCTCCIAFVAAETQAAVGLPEPQQTGGGQAQGQAQTPPPPDDIATLVGHLDLAVPGCEVAGVDETAPPEAAAGARAS